MTKHVRRLDEAGYTIFRDPGVGIKAEKILAQARKVIRKGVTMGTSTHNIQRYDLDTNAFCVIEKEFRLLRK